MLDYRELCFFSTYLNINAGILILSCYHTLLLKNIFSSLQAKFTSLTTSSYSSSYCLWNPKSSAGSCSLQAIPSQTRTSAPSLSLLSGLCPPISMSLSPPSVLRFIPWAQLSVHGSCSLGNCRSTGFTLGSVQEFASLLHKITTHTWKTCCGYSCCTAVVHVWALSLQLW